MPIDDGDHLDFMTKTSKSLGNIESGIQSLERFITAVNVNAKETEKKLSLHLEDPSPHGEVARQGVWSKIGSVVAMLVSVGSLVVVILRK